MAASSAPGGLANVLRVVVSKLDTFLDAAKEIADSWRHVYLSIAAGEAMHEAVEKLFDAQLGGRMQRHAGVDVIDLLQLQRRRSALKTRNVVPQTHQGLKERVCLIAVVESREAARPQAFDGLDRRSLKRRTDNLAPEPHADNMKRRGTAVAF